MSQYPAYLTAPRGTTPPLYYNRPDGMAPSYYPIPHREVGALHVPTTVPTGPVGPPLQPSSCGTHYTVPAVANPFESGLRHLSAAREATVDGGYAQGVPTPRWSVPQDLGRIAAIDAEDAALASEEVALKARLMELRVSRRQQEEEQLRLSAGWAALLEREERYYTEPVPDCTPEILAREQQCAALHDQLQQAEGHRAFTEKRLEATAALLHARESLLSDLRTVQEGFAAVEERRRQCVARAERYFDVEAQRCATAARAARKIDSELKEMASTGPMAQLQTLNTSPSQARRSSSHCVTFAEKSIVLDLGKRAASTSAEARSGPQSFGGECGGPSVCLELNEEDIGGTSVAYSLNNGLGESKRRKVEVPVA